ncbi:molecular chaperone [Sphingorhabdus sp.]|uniref:fimbrial biogenesis chaperone n=1 Tax=Sphingorhabdus sp. TaxID=1902408 RepID=UPI00398362F8
MKSKWIVAVVCALCAAAAYGQQGVNLEISGPSQSFGSAINVTPLRVEMDKTEFADQMQIRNDSAEPINVQLRVFKWTQVSGNDQYSLSNEIILSPSITRIGANQTQNFRLMRASEQKSFGEVRYRIIIDQLPSTSGSSESQTKTRLRFSVPLFVNRDTATAPKLEWQLRGRRLSIINNGGKTVKISGVTVLMPDQRRIEFKGSGTRYVLGNSRVVWESELDTGCIAAAPTLIAVVDQQKINAIPSTTCS